MDMNCMLNQDTNYPDYRGGQETVYWCQLQRYLYCKVSVVNVTREKRANLASGCFGGQMISQLLVELIQTHTKVRNHHLRASPHFKYLEGKQQLSLQ